MRTRSARRLAVFFAGGLSVATLAVSVTARANEDCVACHEDVVKGFAKTNHGVQFARVAAHKDAGCQSCHGKGDVHMQASGEGGILNPKKAKPADANASCLSCHEGKKAQAHWQGSAHERAGARCADCHDVHADVAGTPAPAKGLPGKTTATQTCLKCHGGMRASLHQRSNHPLQEGQMSCHSCHNPHGTAGEKLIEKAWANDLCYSCHQQVRGPFLWEHSPVREDCMTCHRPHGSNYPSLLQARVTQLCQSCHQQGRHQTIAGTPASMWTSNRACLNCHSQIHGSNHPSGPLFQR